jgi:hypothetical protein
MLAAVRTGNLTYFEVLSLTSVEILHETRKVSGFSVRTFSLESHVFRKRVIAEPASSTRNLGAVGSKTVEGTHQILYLLKKTITYSICDIVKRIKVDN